MSTPEGEIVARTPGLPITVASLVADLRALGVLPGMTLLAHTSLKSLGGWVAGGPAAVVLALEEALGPDGTLVMPTFSTDLSDPAGWQHPPVPESWWPVIREQMPAYRPDLTPTREMGAINECFRKQDGARRSAHPAVSFAAWGRHRDAIIAGHALESGLGERSPLARIHDLAGWVLLLGVGHGNNTSLHLSEHRATYPGKHTTRYGVPLLRDGQRRWVQYDDLDVDDGDFVALGADFLREQPVTLTGPVAGATALLMPQRPLVDYGVAWMEQHRK